MGQKPGFMDVCLRDQVGVLRERIKISGDDRALYQELSDLLFQAGKISAAMNILERFLPTTSVGALSANDPAPVEDSIRSGNKAPMEGPEAKWFFDRGLEFADAYLYEDAVECLSQALNSGLDTFETHYCLAGVYKSLQHFSQSEFHCRRSLTLNPRFAPAFILLGSLLKKPGEMEESVIACKRAILLDPECTAAYYDLACYYSLQSKREQALAAITMALCKGFTDFDWLLQDPDLEFLRRNPEFEFLLQSYRQKLT